MTYLSQLSNQNKRSTSRTVAILGKSLTKYTRGHVSNVNLALSLFFLVLLIATWQRFFHSDYISLAVFKYWYPRQVPPTVRNADRYHIYPNLRHPPPLIWAMQFWKKPILVFSHVCSLTLTAPRVTVILPHIVNIGAAFEIQCCLNAWKEEKKKTWCTGVSGAWKTREVLRENDCAG